METKIPSVESLVKLEPGMGSASYELQQRIRTLHAIATELEARVEGMDERENSYVSDLGELACKLQEAERKLEQMRKLAEDPPLASCEVSAAIKSILEQENTNGNDQGQ